MPRQRNPFVRRYAEVQPVLTFGWPELYRYEGWDIEVSRWPTDDPTEWMAQATKGIERLSLMSDAGKQEVLRAIKIRIDVESEGEDAEDLWRFLQGMTEELRKGPFLTRQELSRRIELYRQRHAGERDYPFASAIRWFGGQPLNYRLKFIDRAIQQRELLNGPQVAPNPCQHRCRHAAEGRRPSNVLNPTESRDSRPGRAKPNHPVVNTMRLSNRLLR